MTYFKVKSTVLRGGGVLLQGHNHVLEVGQMPQNDALTRSNILYLSLSFDMTKNTL